MYTGLYSGYSVLYFYVQKYGYFNSSEDKSYIYLFRQTMSFCCGEHLPSDLPLVNGTLCNGSGQVDGGCQR